MHMIAQAQAQLAAAQSMTEVLGASYQAFEQLLAPSARMRDQAGGLFAAFVLAAASAAPARPTAGTSGTAGPAPDPARLASIDEIADALVALSQLIAATLTRAPVTL